MYFITLILSFSFLIGTARCFPEGRVVNGTATEVIKYPFIVSLRGATGSHSCGCSIIAPRWILTAAHCVSGGNPEKISIQYASTKINTNGDNVVGIKRIIRHEDYAPAKSYANDIALLELEGSFVFNYKTLAPVTLPQPYFEVAQNQNGARGVLVGWGRNATGGPVQQNLQEVHLKIYSDEECNLRHNGSTTKDHICGGIDEGWKGQCSGDSGGPLLYNGSVQLGIVSWSIKPCTVPPFPGVYTKVSHYIHWIYKHIS